MKESMWMNAVTDVVQLSQDAIMSKLILYVVFRIQE